MSKKLYQKRKAEHRCTNCGGQDERTLAGLSICKKLKANTTKNIIQRTKKTSGLRQENIRTSDITKCCVSTDASSAENLCPAIISIRNVKNARNAIKNVVIKDSKG